MRSGFQTVDRKVFAMRVLLLAAALAVAAAPAFASRNHPESSVAADPRTMASISHGPDMITRAGFSQKRARAELDSKHPALADTVTAKRWDELRKR